MLIGGDDISNDISTFDTLCLFTFLLAQSMGSHREIGGGVQIPETVASSPSFSRPATRAPWRACSQAMACQ